MGGDDDEALVLRSTAHRMSQGIETKTRKRGILSFDNVFVGTDALEWLLADPKSGVGDLDGAIQAGQRMIEHGYIIRVSRELKAQRVRHFSQSGKAKSEFRGGDAFYRFDALHISPFHLHVVVCRARQLRSMDLNGKNDPYVKLTLGKQTAVTRVRLKTNAPVWNEHFVFGVNSVDAQQLQLSVVDHDRFKLDDHIGSCTVGLSHLPISEGAVDGGRPGGVPLRPYVYSGSRSGNNRNASLSLGQGRDEVWDYGSDDADAATETVTLESSARGWRSGTGSSDPIGNGGLSDRELDPGDWPSALDSDSPGREEQESVARRGGAVCTRLSRRAARPSVEKRILENKDSIEVLPPRKSGQRSRGSGIALLGERAKEEVEEKYLTYYRLLTTNERRLTMGKLGGTSLEKQSAKAGELACDIWLTSFQPKPLPVQGESKFTLRCRMWEMCGVTSPEERYLPVISSTAIKHRVVLMTCEDRVSSKVFERRKYGERRTDFHGSVISLDLRANMATDMLKFVVQQKLAPVELTYKPVATVSVPLRSIPVSFPEGDRSDPKAAVASAPTGAVPQPGGHEKSASATGGGTSRWRASTSCGWGGERKGCGGECETGQRENAQANGLGGEESSARRYRLQTLAGPMTTRTIDNGFVVMSLTLVPSGNDLLGEPEPEDSEGVKNPPPPPPRPLTSPVLDSTLDCGYQRLRKALLWNDSKLQVVWNERLNFSDVTYSPWVNRDGSPGQEDLTGCKRERTFVIPKSAMVAATRAEARDEVSLDGPARMVFETRNTTPGVPYGDKFSVAVQFVLTKEGPEKCRLQTSAEAVFSDNIIGFVQRQIVAAVTKVTRENHGHLLTLIEDAISGKGPGVGSAAQQRLHKSRRFLCRWCLRVGLLVLLLLPPLLLLTTTVGFLPTREAFGIPSGFTKVVAQRVSSCLSGQPGRRTSTSQQGLDGECA